MENIGNKIENRASHANASNIVQLTQVLEPLFTLKEVIKDEL